jgi:signal transduction histidine kinase
MVFFQKLSIKNKIMVLGASSGTILILTSLFSIYSIKTLENNHEYVSNELLPMIQSVDSLTSTINRIRLKQYKYLLLTSKEERSHISNIALPRFEKELKNYISTYMSLIHSTQEKKTAQHFIVLYNTYNKTWQKVAQLEDQGQEDAATQLMKTVGLQTFTQAENTLDTISQHYLNASIAARKQESQYAHFALFIILLTDLLAISFTLFLGLYLSRLISSPVQQLTLLAKEIADGKEFESIPSTDAVDEVGVLNQAFQVMVHNIGLKTHSLEAVNHQLESELEERKRLERQLLHAKKMEAIGTLTGGIAHDFNNLLWMIVGNCEILLDMFPENSKEAEVQRDIMQASERAKALVQQLLDFSKKTDFVMENFSIYSLVSEITKQMRIQIPEEIKITTLIEPSERMVCGDPNKIHRVITNVISNAYQAIGENENGEVIISLSELEMSSKDIGHFPKGAEPGHYQLLEIADTGCGMSKDTASQIFDPFFTTKTLVGSGNGLGLAIAYSIIAEMKGYITVYSELGQGSVFKIFLPTVSPEQKMYANTLDHADTEDLEGIANIKRKILLVDDEPLIRVMMQRLIENLGHEVELCQNGDIGLKRILADPNAYDLVISDQMMPVMYGVEMAQRAYKVNAQLPIIIISGNTLAITQKDLENTNIVAVMNKPIQYRELKNHLYKIWKSLKANS